MYKMMKAVVTAAALFTLASTAWGAELKIGAGAAPTENVLKPIKDAFEKSSGIKLSILANGPKNALLDLDKGVVEAAAAGLSFDDWLALMKKEGVEVKDPAAYNRAVIGKDQIKVIVNKENKIGKLTAEQLQGIFSGEIASWKEVGGDDQPILVVLGKLVPGTNSMFLKKFLGTKAFAKDVLDATTAEDVKQNVVSNPSAIAFGPLALVDDTVNVPETPELSRDITLLTKGSPSANVQKLLDFIKGEGQKYIRK